MSTDISVSSLPLTPDVLKDKFKAFGVHLVVSILIFAASVAVFVLLFYPQPYFVADGGLQGMRIAAGVDLVLGPLLSFVVYRKGKKGLRFDYIVIGVAQVAAMLAGLYLVHMQRPLFTVYAIDTFYTVTWEDLIGRGLDRAQLDALAKKSKGTLPLVYVKLPMEHADRAKFFEDIAGGAEPRQMSSRFVPISAEAMPYLARSSESIDKFVKRYPEIAPLVDQFAGKRNKQRADFAFFVMEARYQQFLLVLDKSTGDEIGFIRLPDKPAKAAKST